MTLPTTYSTGTASVASGGHTTITFAGGAMLGTEDAPNIMAGDLFCDPAQPLVPPQRIASVDYTAGTASLAVNWPGTTMSAVAYEVRYVGIVERSTAQTRRLLEQMSVVTANGRGLFFTFDDATADSDPSSGKFRFNNATIASATAAYIDNLDADGANAYPILDTWDDTGSSLARGQLWVRSIASPSTFAAFNVTGSVVDGTGYRKLTLSYIGGGGSLAAGDEIMVAFVPFGPSGLNAGLKYTFNSSTSSADPTTGKLGFNNGTLSSATALYISETDADGNGIAALLATWDDSTNSIRGALHIEKDGTPGTFADFSVTGSLTDNGTWDSLVIAYVTGSGSFSNGDALRVRFSRTGDKGADGTNPSDAIIHMLYGGL